VENLLQSELIDATKKLRNSERRLSQLTTNHCSEKKKKRITVPYVHYGMQYELALEKMGFCLQ
jgi:hypothetical protein